MREIPISAVPGQTLTLTQGNDRYQITLKEARGVMACDVSANGTDLVRGSRVLAGEMLIPYLYLEIGGNFILSTVADELPDWQQFGLSQFLYFLPSDELEVIRAGN